MAIVAAVLNRPVGKETKNNRSQMRKKWKKIKKENNYFIVKEAAKV